MQIQESYKMYNSRGLVLKYTPYEKVFYALDIYIFTLILCGLYILEIIITLPSISEKKKIEISLIYEHYSLVGIIIIIFFSMM